jgi:hypothetical protein
MQFCIPFHPLSKHPVIFATFDTNKTNLSGLKGVKKDGETSKVYRVLLHESAGWTHVSPGKYLQEGGRVRTSVSKQDMLRCLDTLSGLRVRGGFYSGPEKSQLRWISIKQVDVLNNCKRGTLETSVLFSIGL